MIVKRRCVNLVSTEAFDILSQGKDSESCGNSWGDVWDGSCGLSDCDVDESACGQMMCLSHPPWRWLRCMKVFPRILIGNLLNRSPFFLPRSVRLFVRIVKAG